MRSNMSEPITTSIVAKHGSLALFGALVHALMAHRTGQSKTLMDLLVLMLVSSFTGVMFALLALHLFADDEYITLMCAGTGGYVGVEGMSIIVNRLKKFLIK